MEDVKLLKVEYKLYVAFYSLQFLNQLQIVLNQLQTLAKLNLTSILIGTCEEAFNFYKSVFGGEFSYFSKMGEINMEGMPIPDEDRNLVMHVSLPIGDDILMGSDVSSHVKSHFKSGNNNYISLMPDSREEAAGLFMNYLQGVKWRCDGKRCFWGVYFGSFRDDLIGG